MQKRETQKEPMDAFARYGEGVEGGRKIVQLLARGDHGFSTSVCSTI